MSRRRSREYALQMLFQWDLSGIPKEEILEIFWAGRQVRGEVRQTAEELFLKAVLEIESIDGCLHRASRNWKLERMSAVDRNVLRVAIAEFMLEETPRAVIINEAVEIARRYGTEESPEFVNGILDAVGEDLERALYE